MNEGASAYEQILKEYQDSDNDQIRKSVMLALGAVQSQALKQRTLDWAVKSGQVKMQDTFYPIGSVTASIEGTELAWKYFQEVSTSLFLEFRCCTLYECLLFVLY